MKTSIKIILISLSTVFALHINAQNPLSIGVKAGANLSDYTGDIDDNDMKIGYNAGVTVDYKLSKRIFLLSGLEVISKGTKTDSKNDLPGAPTKRSKTTYDPLYLQIPIHVGITLKATDDMNVLFHLGPYVGYGISGKLKTEVTDANGVVTKGKSDLFGSDGILKKWDVGLGLGAGFEMYGIGINLGYELGFLNQSKVHIINPEGIISDDRISLKNNTFRCSLIYRFGQE